ncbi:MAG: class I SAM-dependent methyltransferase [Acidiferrobacter sp.]
MAKRLTLAQALDVGCGAGHTSFAIAPFRAAVHAVDARPAMLEIVASEARVRDLPRTTAHQALSYALTVS